MSRSKASFISFTSSWTPLNQQEILSQSIRFRDRDRWPMSSNIYTSSAAPLTSLCLHSSPFSSCPDTGVQGSVQKSSLTCRIYGDDSAGWVVLSNRGQGVSIRVSSPRSALERHGKIAVRPSLSKFFSQSYKPPILSP
jgi:hypothetical protein